MAEQIQDIKRRIRGINSTEHITNAMKLVSASKLRRAKAVYEHSKMYLDRILESIDEIFDNTSKIPDKFVLGKRKVDSTCYIVITSNTGLCGSFNGNVIREAEKAIQTCQHPVKLVNIGSKGREYFEHRGRKMEHAYDLTTESIDYDKVKEISKPLVEKYMSGEIGEIVLVFTSYINTLKQEVIKKHILPVDIDAREERHDEKKEYVNVIEYGPSVEEVFNYMVGKYVEMTLYNAVIESATCEHAARRQAMENASDNARDMLMLLRMQYNRARQSQITGEIIEIVSGSEALG